MHFHSFCTVNILVILKRVPKYSLYCLTLASVHVIHNQLSHYICFEEVGPLSLQQSAWNQLKVIALTSPNSSNTQFCCPNGIKTLNQELPEFSRTSMLFSYVIPLSMGSERERKKPPPHPCQFPWRILQKGIHKVICLSVCLFQGPPKQPQKLCL